ncbi:MAG: hypothetical protein LIO90_11770 [Bacteroidales bacterium]|nr:hypothetical protein [Bacteroidales bacterium]
MYIHTTIVSRVPFSGSWAPTVAKKTHYPMRFVDPSGWQVEEDQADALRRIDNFMENYSSPSFFKNIDKASFGKNLKSIISDPTTIQQGKNGTCGAAAALKYLSFL